MPEGTITLPSGDKLITQIETLPGGALVHREEIVLSGTISNTTILPTTSQPSAGVYALPTWIVAMPTQVVDAAIHAMNAVLSNSIAISGQVNDVATTTVNEGRVGPPRITPQRALHSNLRDQSGREIGTAGTPLHVSTNGVTQPVSIAANVNIGAVAGTVQVAFTPSATQAISSVAGTVRIDPTGQTTQPVSLAVPVTIGAVQGTVNVAFTPAAVQSVNLLNVGFAGTPLRTDPTGTTTQPVSMAGSISLPDYARYSEQLTHSTRLSTLDTDVLAITAAVLGTPAVKFASAQSVTISGVPSVSVPGTPAVTVFGTPSVAIASSPPVTFASAQPISTVAGTVSVTFPSAQSVSISNTPNVVVPGTPAVSVFGTPSVAISTLPPITFASPQPISTVAGTVSVTFPSAQSVSISNTPNVVVPGTPAVTVFGTPSVAISTIPAITLTGSQSISTIAGTVSVTFPSAQSVSISNTPNVAVPGTPAVSIFGTPSVAISTVPSITFTSAQPISTVAGTVTVNVRNSGYTLKTARVDIGSSGNAAIAGSIFGKRLKVYAVNVNADRRGTVAAVWMDGTTSLSGTQTFVDREGFTMAVPPPAFLFAPSPGTSVQIHVPAGNTAGLRGMVSFWDDDAV